MNILKGKNLHLPAPKYDNTLMIDGLSNNSLIEEYRQSIKTHTSSSNQRNKFGADQGQWKKMYNQMQKVHDLNKLKEKYLNRPQMTYQVYNSNSPSNDNFIINRVKQKNLSAAIALRNWLQKDSELQKQAERAVKAKRIKENQQKAEL